MEVTHRQASMMLLAIWLDLTIDRGKVSDETVRLLGLHFGPHFSTVKIDDYGIKYRLQAVHEPGGKCDEIQIALGDPKRVHPVRQGDQRLDVNRPMVRAFLDQARAIIGDALDQEFPKGEVKTSFAYEAFRLINLQEGTTDEDHPPSTG